MAGPNESGDSLVVGQPNPGFLEFLARFPLPDDPSGNQQICNPIQLVPGLYANAYVPTAEERGGNFGAFAGLLKDPANRHLPFPGGIIPVSRFNPSDSDNVFPIFAWRIAGDANQPVQISLRRLKVLVIAAGVKVMPDYAWEFVAPTVRSALLDLYSFDRRSLGQPAFLSEAVAAIQAVPGVQYVDMRTFDAISESVSAAELATLATTLTTHSFVEAELARVDPLATDPARRIAPAELAILTPDIPDTLILTEITT